MAAHFQQQWYQQDKTKEGAGTMADLDDLEDDLDVPDEVLEGEILNENE